MTFGSTENVFELTDAAPPVAHARNQKGRLQRAWSRDLLVLPSEESPSAMVFQRHGAWFIEGSDGGQGSILDGSAVLIGDDLWTLHLPEVVEPTRRRDEVAPRLHEIGLRFSVNLDEESIGLLLLGPTGPLELRQRVHFEMLLRLGEARIADQEAGIVVEESGWLYVPDLLKRLDVADDPQGRNLIHQHIFQARQQLARAGIEDAVDLIERRHTVATENARRIGQIRIGVGRVEIVYPGRGAWQGDEGRRQ
ncbi:hypothetical protein [Haliangium sp.]|uniref:hypothetical protein n=1 Tax=Haliangium sp. TaxID=2663208 RepID=UPI003D126809